MPADDRVGSGSQDRAAAAQAGRGGTDFVVAEAQRRPRQNWGNRASLTLAPPGRHNGQDRRQSPSDVGRAGEALTHAVVFPNTARQSPFPDNRRCPDSGRQVVAPDFSGKVAGVVALVIIGKTAASTTDLSTCEVDLAFTPRPFGCADRGASRGRGVSIFMIRSFWPKGSPGAIAPGRCVSVRRRA